MPTYKKKLIEVALPLEAINAACVADKERKTGHIRNLHKWFAPMPLPAWRAALFATLIDDPSNNLPAGEAEVERARLFRIIEDIVPFEAIRDARALAAARAEIRRSCDGTLPPILDPFCGGGSTVVEAQRLGLKAIASDLNPIAVLITKMLTTYPPQFINRSPVNPNRGETLEVANGLSGLIADIRYYAELIRQRAWERVGHLYPTTSNGSTVLAWRWARTVPSPDPRAQGAHTPLVTDWWLSKHKAKKAWIEASMTGNSVSFSIARTGAPPKGTTGRTAARCLFTGGPIPLSYIREQGRSGRLGLRLLAMVIDNGARDFVDPDPQHESLALAVNSQDAPSLELPARALGFRVQEYGMRTFSDLMTPRQATTLKAFAELVSDVRGDVVRDATQSWSDSPDLIETYAEAIVTMLGLCVGKLAQSSNSLVRWKLDSRNGTGKPIPAFDRHAVPMVWDFVETNPFGGSVGDWTGPVVSTALRALDIIDPSGPPAEVQQLDARAVQSSVKGSAVVATDPPYYANIGYADLSDFFYIWLRLALKDVHPLLFSTIATPKTSELIASPYRHENGAAAANDYFREGFGVVFEQLSQLHAAEFPMTVVYALKQQEVDDDGVSSTGWEVMLEGLREAGLAIVGTWPIRTTGSNRMIGIGTNALASAILIVCRPSPLDSRLATRKEFVAELKRELPTAVRTLQHGNIAPVDLAQASIGPGMAVFSRYAKVLEADGTPMSVRTCLSLINQVLDEAVVEQESEFDPTTRWAVAWFEQQGVTEGQFGTAETLSKAKNTSINGMKESGILVSSAGKVRLLKKEEMTPDWDPTTDPRLTLWEITHYLVARLETEGESGAAELLRKVGGMGEAAKDLAYRLFIICDRKKWSEDALAYNALVTAWPEISRLASLAPEAQSAMEF